MGVPLSSYSVLTYIAEGQHPRQRTNNPSIEMELALDSLSNYSLFAFIIHDPAIQTDFHYYIQQQFKNFHYSTGQHLVFFSLVDYPEKYKLIGENPFYQDIREMITLFEEQEQPHRNNSTYTSFALAHSLGISPDMLPVIVVTHDPRLVNFRWYKTCHNKIDAQMNRLTSVSKELKAFRIQQNYTLEQKQDMLFKLLDEQDLDLCKGNGQSTLNESMARALSNLLSFIIVDSKSTNSNWAGRQIELLAFEQRRKVLGRAMASLRVLKNHLGGENYEEIDSHQIFPKLEEVSIAMAIKLRLLDKKHNEDYYFSLLKKDWFDTTSYNMIETALGVEQFLKRTNFSNDFSPSAICIGKMFEQEINNSIVHFVRNKLSVQLPEYYNKYQPGVDAKLNTNPAGRPFIIDFNAHFNGVWKPLELGKSKNTVRFTFTKTDWDELGISDYQMLLDEWHTIHITRNKAAHSNEVSYTDLEKMKKSLFKLSKNNTLAKLAEIKAKYKSPESVL